MSRLGFFGSMRSVIVGSILFSMLSGCAAPRPRVFVESSSGIVRADNEVLARQVGAWLDELLPAVQSCIPYSLELRPEVWVQEKLRLYRNQDLPDEVYGFNASIGNRIHVREDAENLKLTLAHEIVHAVLDPSWETLPGVLEEGLCEWTSLRVVSQGRAGERAKRLFQSALYLGELSGKIRVSYQDAFGFSLRADSSVTLSTRDEDALPPKEALALSGGFADLVSGDLSGVHYAFGHWVVSRIERNVSLTGLHRLCQEARERGQELIPVQEILRASRLEVPVSDWQDRVLDEVGDVELCHIAVEIREDLVRGLIKGVRKSLPGELSAQEFLNRSVIRFGLVGRGRLVSLGDLPLVCDEIRRQW